MRSILVAAISIVPLAVSALLAPLAVHQYLRDRAAMDWPIVSGKVLEADIEQRGKTYIPNIRYAYRVGERRFESTCVWIDGRRSFHRRQDALIHLRDRTTGAVVTVHHHPDHPADSALIVGGTRDARITGGISAALMAVCLLGFAEARRKRRRELQGPPADKPPPTTHGRSPGALAANQWADIIERAQREAADHPRRHACRMVAFGLLGQSCLLILFSIPLVAYVGLLLGLESCTPANIAVFVGSYTAMLAMLLRALWVRRCTPEGIALLPEVHAPLFAQVEEMRRKMRAPRIHSVRLSGQLDPDAFHIEAAPRLSVFGWPRRTLTIGLPALVALPEPEARALLARELASQSPTVGRVAGWVVRLASAFLYLEWQVIERAGHIDFFLMAPFLRRFVPRFRAWACALTRQLHLQADHLAARATDRRLLADALIRMELVRCALARSWPVIRELTELDAPSGSSVCTSIWESLRLAASADSAAADLDKVCRVEYPLDRARPGPGDRLTHLGQQPRLPPIHDGPAAAIAWFGERLPAMESDLGRLWAAARAAPSRRRNRIST